MKYHNKMFHKIISLSSGYGKDFIHFSLGYFIFSAISFCTIIIVNRNLSQEELGKYSYIKSIFELLVSAVSLNVYSVYLRFNLRGCNNSVKNKVQIYIWIITIFLFGVFIFISKSVFAALFVFILIMNERNYYFRSVLSMCLLNISRIIPALLAFLSIAVIILFKITLTGEYVLAAYGIGYMFTFFLYKPSSKYIYIDDTLISFTTIMKYSIPLGLLVIVDWILNLSALFIIKQLFGFGEVAVYAVAQRALLAFKLFSGIFLMFYPSIYYREIDKKNKSMINKSRLYMTFFLFIISMIIIAFAKFLYTIMGASDYSQYINIFRILVISEFVRTTASFYGLFFSYKLKTLSNLIIVTIGALLNVVMLLIFLENGIEFAAYSSLISVMIILILVIFFSYFPEQKYFNCK